MSHRFMSGALLVALLAGGALPGTAQAQTWKPVKHVELIVPFAAASGMDGAARMIHGIWTSKRLIDATSTVVNKAGGGGNLGLAYAGQHAGDPHYLVLASSTMATNHITGLGKLNHTDFTPIGIMVSEFLVFSVKPDSPLRTGNDFVQRLRSDPQALSISIGSQLGNINHIAVASVARAAGVDPKRLKVVAFGSSGEGMTALLGGHIDVQASTLGVIAPQVEAGKLRAIALTSPRRLIGALSDVPTWTEQGVPLELSLWRGVFGPKGIAPEHVAHWERILAGTSKTDEWQAIARKQVWDGTFQGSREMRAFADQDYAALKAALTDVGLAK